MECVRQLMGCVSQIMGCVSQHMGYVSQLPECVSQLMGCVSSEGSDEHVHICSLARAITVSTQSDCTLHQ